MSSEQRDVLSLKITYALHDIALALVETHESLTYDALVKEFRSRPVDSLNALVASAYHVAEVNRQRENEV